MAKDNKQILREGLIQKFNISPLDLGEVKPFKEKEYKKALDKMMEKALNKSNKELKKFLKKEGLPETLVELKWND